MSDSTGVPRLQLEVKNMASLKQVLDRPLRKTAARAPRPNSRLSFVVDGQEKTYAMRGSMVSTIKNVARQNGIAQYSVKVVRRGQHEAVDVDEDELMKMGPRSVKSVEISTFDEAGNTA